MQQNRAGRDHVDQHLADRTTLAVLVTDAGPSRFHRVRPVRAMGTSLPDVVLRHHVERTRSLPARTRTPILDIALICGFADRRHLDRQFTARVGVAPGRSRDSGSG